MSQLVGNLLVAQSGGPTAAINASIAGVITEAGRHPDEIEEIYGGLNGVLGILNEELIDIQEEQQNTIDSLRWAPAAALGTCRYKIDFKKKPEQAAKDMDRLQARIPPEFRFSLHVNMISHGRATCLPAHPRCDRCSIRQYCPQIGVPGRGRS